MNQNDCSGKTLKLWPVFVDHYTLNHKKAGATVMHVFAELNQEISRRDTNVNGEMMADAQRKLRELPVNKLCLINPFSLRT